MIKPILLLTYLFLLLQPNLIAQHKEVLLSEINLPVMKPDSVTKFNNALVESTLISNIKESKADIEIRVYYRKYSAGLFAGGIGIIRAYSDTIEVVKYNYSDLSSILNYEYMHPEKQFIDVDSIQPDKKSYLKEYIYRQIRKRTVPFPATSFKEFIIKLNEADFFQIMDQSKLLDSLRKNKIHFNSPCDGVTDCPERALVFFEVKVGQVFRNFNLLQLDFFEINKSLAYFKNQKQVLSILKSYGIFL